MNAYFYFSHPALFLAKRPYEDRERLKGEVKGARKWLYKSYPALDF
jgi:hypothetical protein